MFDENLQQRAHKSEYVNVLNEIRLYLKRDEFDNFSGQIRESFFSTNSAISNLNEQQAKADIRVLETIELKINEVQRRLDKRMN